ncbi:HEAT repeat domain-containing protein [Isosphaeraceae bacterium EP7]
MTARREGFGRRAIAGLLGLIPALGLIDVAGGDVISLKSGGSVRGKVLPDPENTKTVTILMERGKTPLSFRKEQVVSVSPEPSILDEYLPRRLAVAESSRAEDQYDLAAWCQGHKLPDLAQVHYQATIKLDPGHDEAHRQLGHAQVGDRWLTRDELRQVQGMVKHKGKWITAEEKDRQEADAGARSQEASWSRRLKILHAAIVDGGEPRRTEAEQQLREIRDENAVRPLLRAFGAESTAIRSLLVRVLGEIPGSRAGTALVEGFLHEDDAEVRQSAMTEIARRKDAGSIPRLSNALRSRDVRVVNRAAWALGNLKATSALQRLIGALTTVEEQVVWMPTGQAPPPSSVGVIGAVAPAPASVGGFQGGLSGGGSYALLTPPVVAPGAVAFGAAAMPLGPTADFGYNGAMSAGKGPMPVSVPYVNRNVEVREALIKLTGQDFGFDAQAWRRWIATSFRPEVAPARSVPQP